MANRQKEDEKNEKIIRGLTKLSENRKCINCGNLGPQYVCTNFSIFICTTCSGMHREFTHRVKSISIAKFTPAEVAALQAGGNQRAREIYFKEWDSSRQSLPDASNPDKLRDFIRAVYVERRFTGDRQKGRLSDSEDPYDSRRPDRFKYSQSPSYDDRNDDRRYTNRPGSRGSDRGFDEKMSPARFDYERDRYDRGYQNDRERDRRYDDRDRHFDERDRRLDEKDRRYDERDRNYDDRDGMRRFDDRDRRYEDRDRRYDERDRSDDRERKPDERDPRGRSFDDWDKRPNRPSNYRGGETPPIRSVREILGDDIPKLRVEDNIRTNGRPEDVESPHSVSSQGEGRVRSSKPADFLSNGNSNASAPAPQLSISESLIDFSADPEPPKTNTEFDPFGTSEQPQPSVVKANTQFDPFGTSEQPSVVTSSSTGWASFDLSPPKVTAAPTAAGTFLQQTVSDSSTQGKANGGQAEWPPQPSTGMHSWPSLGAQPGQQAPASFQEQWTSSIPFRFPQTDPMQQPQKHQQWNSSIPQQMDPLQQPQKHQQWNSSIPQQVDPLQQPQQLQPQNHRFSPDNVLQQKSVPSTSTQQRRQIPEDLFFMPQAAPFNGGMHMAQGPQFGFAQGPQFGAQFVPGPMPSYAQPAKNNKSNPFDLPGDSLSNPTVAAFPSMSPLQSALPSFGAGPMSSPGPGLGGPPPQWSQSAFGPPPVPPASYPPASYPGAGFNQQQPPPPNMMPHLMQGHFARPNAGFGNPGAFMNGPASYTGAPNSMQPAASGGNPFG